MMNLYLISQSVNTEYDTYDSAVVAAPSEEVAKLMHPDGGLATSKFDPLNCTWCEPKDVDVQYIGETTLPKSVICASFNAG